ncbi:TPA: Ldh family oxidoreductase [Burkholderia cenocepacia]|nr:Ldh family oxidoreductase [Burkholderia cenocepacia]
MKEDKRIDPAALQSFIAAVYGAVGVPDEDAALVADSLVQADLWGHQSHGVLRTRWYLERLKTGAMSARTQIERVVDGGAIGVIDGKDGVGQVIASHAMADAIRRAKQHGIGAVAVRNSNHFGTVMYFTRMAAGDGCIAFATTNGGPAMAPWGGMQKIVGTNPWSIAAPVDGRDPFMTDMANTGVARGKIYLAKQRREQIPAGWALGPDGAPTTDPAEAIAGIILPMAHHKGYAIATAMDMLAGVLTGSGFLDQVNGPYHRDRKSNAGHFVFVLNIDAFMRRAEFADRMGEFVSRLKSVPKAQGADEIYYPGEIEAVNHRKNSVQGLSLPEDTLADLASVANELGLGGLLPF